MSSGGTNKLPNRQCEYCLITFHPKNRYHRFHTLKCKGLAESESKRANRPTKEWLEEKYLIEKLDCPAIGQLLSKDAKTIYTWLKDTGIPTRPRGSSTKGFRANGIIGGRPGGWKMSDKQKEQIRQARLKDGHVPYLRNGKHWLKGKRGAASPVWKGGITPERQEFYGTLEWKQAANLVWRRDYGKCQRCKVTKYEASANGIGMDIHHIVSFAVRELRLELSNLTLLCETCHYWVHSKANINKEFIKEYDNN